MKILILAILMSLNTFAADSNQKLPEIGHLVKTYCLNGTQYYYYEEDRSGGLAPVIVNGKFLECEKSEHKCKRSTWDASITCE